ncbi:MAG: motility associated factor glycosyltransferase family protein [Clostridium sp.]|nr:motility associated factor glycosyltransferase family protein [Clostridium sp.]
MNSVLLQNNLKILKFYGYDEELLKAPVLDIEKSKQGYNNIHYQIGDEGKVYIHSQYNMERELEMLEKPLDIEKRDAVYIVYGLGLGYHIKSLREKVSPKSLIFVIEKNADIISTFMQTQDFSQIAGRNIMFLFGTDEEIITGFNDKIFSIDVISLFGNLTNVILPSYHSIYKNWISLIQDRIMDTIRHAFFMLGNDMEDTIIGIQNNLENIDEVLKSPSIRNFKDSYTDIPLFIISAGPSLDKNVEELKNAWGKSLIIATDAVLSTLKKHEITPDGVVSIERVIMLYEKFYKGKELDPETVFIGPPVVRSEVFATLKNNKKLVCLKEGERINEWLNDIVGDERTLLMGTSCAHIAFSFGRYIGANPIVFVGQDLAYTKDGVTHSGDVEVKKKVDTKEDKNIDYVKDYDGNLLPTSRAFKQFLVWYELQIAKSGGDREYIDATEGGANIKGTKQMTLKKTIESYCGDAVTPLHKKVFMQEIDSDKYGEIIKKIRELMDEFDEIKKESEAQIIRLDKLQTKIIRDKKTLALKDKEKIIKAINQVKAVENLLIKNHFARNLFQGPFVTAASRIRMLGNSLEDENLKENVIIQRRMVESFFVGCCSVIKVLDDILQRMEKEQEDRQ